MSKEYLTFVEDWERVAGGGKMELFIKDFNPGIHKYESKHVLALVGEAVEMEEADILWVRSRFGQLQAGPYRMRILEVLDDIIHKRFSE